MGKKTHEEFLYSFFNNNKHADRIEVISAYTGANNRIECKCKECGNVWSPIASSLTLSAGRATGCPFCAGKRRTHDDFISLFKINNPHSDSLTIVGTYTGIDDPIECKCLVCGYQWSPIANQLLHKGAGCKKCSNAKKRRGHLLTHEEFIAKFEDESAMSGIVEILGEYQGRSLPIECKCRICGNVWQPTPNNLLQGKGCPRCAHAQTSYFEQFVLQAFRVALGVSEVRSRDKKTVGRELDIFLPSYSMAYEVGSWYWHRNKVKNDWQKHELCKEHGIQLITVYDGCTITKPSLECPPFEDCIIYQQDLGTDRSSEQLREFIQNELKRIGVEYDYRDDEWEGIASIASINSRAMTDSDFRELVFKSNPYAKEFVILGEFSSGEKSIECECSVCGTKWQPKARRLIEGHGCPSCSRKRASESRRKTHEQFLRDFALMNPNSGSIRFLSRYVTSNTPIQCHCDVCGFEWSATPENLLGSKRPGCPQCGREKSNKAHVKTQQEFEADFHRANKNANNIDIGEYTGVKNKIECHCRICNYRWSAMPSNLLAGKGCPNWRAHKALRAE